ncbi:hypothetical protein A0H81_03788 [Grifola frondosa]|uniref:Fido domain-containing protein n=1 Tax=Grifola frondosa TaxID=5627 RepID=A0A1C7MHU1_GRIFR|nr:hypothetical protein A0H81_03788 [Grifola frondosa]
MKRGILRSKDLAEDLLKLPPRYESNCELTDTFVNLNDMATHAARLAHLFTPAYASRINAQIVYPSISHVVKPNELESALARPLHVSVYEPHRRAVYLAATLSYGIIKGHPFMDGNKRTAFFLANEYLRAQGMPGLAGVGKVGVGHDDLINLADLFIDTAAGRLNVEGLEARIGGDECLE